MLMCFDWQVFKLGVTPNSKYSTPNLDYMLPGKRKAHLQERAFVALFVAAHRGHLKLVEKLISEGTYVLVYMYDNVYTQLH